MIRLRLFTPTFLRAVRHLTTESQTKSWPQSLTHQARTIKFTVENEIHEVSDQLEFSHDRDDEIIIIDQQKFVNGKRKTKLPKLKLLRETIDANAATLMIKEPPWEEPLVDSINAMKPVNDVVSAERYEQVKLALKAAFSKHQLAAFAGLYGASLKATKSSSIEYIIDRVWQLRISSEVKNDLVTEKVYGFRHRRELVLVLSNNAAIPRSWTRLGAGIVINPKTLTLTVRAPGPVADDILNRLDHITSHIVESEIELPHATTTIDSIPLSLISRLTSTDLEFTSQSTIRVSALGERSGYKHIDVARRLAVLSLNTTPTHDRVLFPPGSLSHQDKSFYRVDTDDALPWNRSTTDWVRWREIAFKKDEHRTMREFGFEYPMLLAREVAKLTEMKCEVHDRLSGAYFDRMLGMNPGMNADANVSSAVVDIISGVFSVDKTPDEVRYDSVLDLLGQHGDFTATFGVALHNRTLLSTRKVTDQSYFFLASAPQFTRFIDVSPAKFELIRHSASSIERKFLVLRFVNVLGAEPGRAEMLIPVREQVAVHDDASVRTCAQDTVVDMLLPAESVDVRFSKTVWTDVRIQDTVREFLANLKVDFSSRQNVPASIVLNGQEYMFELLEQRTEVRYEYEGYVVKYSIVEAGNLNGRRIQVDLVPVTADHKFVNSAIGLAAGVSLLGRTRPELLRVARKDEKEE
ncbi:mitochondrial inner-membrane-bound regulator-domain-containing protein [Lipomyces arxii]|uniref:mitochondrial inner-membrane-bound regulator-domain-containing protein n=1 Tax=Lipomyces arxii TaxID=56418 RepID=UPI0034CD12B2